MTEDLTREVTCGGRSYRIARFKGFKAQRIMRETAAIGKRYPEITDVAASFERSYAESHALRLSRTEAEMRFGERAREISNEAWEQSEGILPLKQMPDAMERLGAIWPDLVNVAEENVGNLLAVISLSNEELRKADEEDDVENVIRTRAREIFHEGDVEEILDLAIAGYDVARGQFAPLVAKIAPLAAMLGIPTSMPTTDPTTDELEQTESNTSPTTDPLEDSPDTPPNSETNPSSSIDSQPPTDGAGERSSTEPLGEPSSPLPTG